MVSKYISLVKYIEIELETVSLWKWRRNKYRRMRYGKNL
jgi:hypothetical protein